MGFSEDFKIDFVIAGVTKGGTTSLYNYLKSHPQLFFPNVKETNFFVDSSSTYPEDFILPKKGKYYHSKVINDEMVYESLFAHAKAEMLKGEASPSYMIDPNAPARMNSAFPEMKIIICIRNPVDRIHSHFLMNRRTGIEKEKNFLQAVQKDMDSNEKLGIKQFYLQAGKYSAQIKSYRRLFGEENVKILIFEEFQKNVQQTLLEIFKFLKIREIKLDTSRVHNSHKEAVNESVMQFLRNQKIKFLFRKILPENAVYEVRERFLYREKAKPNLNQTETDFLNEYYSEEIKELKQMFPKLQNLWQKN